jgi:hypothetical protein
VSSIERVYVRVMSRQPEGEARTQSTTDWAALLDQQRAQELTEPVLGRWGSGAGLFAVRRRLQAILGTGLVIVAIQLLLSPSGITGLLIRLWFFLSLPVVTVAGCLLVLLRNPSDAPSVWWENSVPATLGLVSLAGLIRAGNSTPAGRAVWGLVFGEDSPTDGSYQFGDEGIDLSAVSKIRRYIWYAIAGSTVIVVVDQTIRNDLFGRLFGSGSTQLGAGEFGLVLVGGLLAGIFVGALAAMVGR